MSNTVNLSDNGMELLEEAQSTFEVEPNNRKTVEAALEKFVEYRKTEVNN